MRFQLLLAASALDVPYEFFTLDFSTADYSRMKAVLMLSNKSMRNWSAWMARNLTRLWNWRIAKAMAKKDLPPAPSVDGVSQWNRVEWQSPAEPWVDQQESNQADMLAWQLGLAPLSVAAKRRGGDLEDLLREKARNIVMANAIEKEMGLPANTLIQAQMPGQTLNNSGDVEDDSNKQDMKEGDEE
jgi:capsid protein